MPAENLLKSMMWEKPTDTVESPAYGIKSIDKFLFADTVLRGFQEKALQNCHSHISTRASVVKRGTLCMANFSRLQRSKFVYWPETLYIFSNCTVWRALFGVLIASM
jgi:hypothetical protein